MDLYGNLDANEYGLGPPASKPGRESEATTRAQTHRSNYTRSTDDSSVTPSSNGFAGRTSSKVAPLPRNNGQPVAGQDGPYDDEDWNDCWTWVKYPPLSPEFAAICFVLNMILPGIGTLIATFSLFCCAETEHWTSGQKICAFFFGIFVGLLQLATAIIVIGWIWSCIWGSKIFMKASKRHHGNDDYVGKDEESIERTVAEEPRPETASTLLSVPSRGRSGRSGSVIAGLNA